MAGYYYKNITKGSFLSRPNRFIANVLINGREETVHVKNTGRCRELLLPGTEVYLEPAAAERKTKWSLIGVRKGKGIVNIDSQVPNKIVEGAIKSGRLKLPGISEIFELRREKTYGASRFDLYFETENQKGFIEVKGVTLEADGIAMFPDAPTERGTRHLNELIHATNAGYCCFIIFVVQMKGVKHFEPNIRTDSAFGDALRKAVLMGVNVIAVDCSVGQNYIELDGIVDVYLNKK